MPTLLQIIVSIFLDDSLLRSHFQKCDSARPVCTPCLRGERAEDCEYTDGQHRPLTLTLEEDIARLRERVRELENPEATLPVELHAPYAGAGAGASEPSTGMYIVTPSVQILR